MPCLSTASATGDPSGPQISRPTRTCGSALSAAASALVRGTLLRRPPFGDPSTPFLICRAIMIRPATRSRSSHRRPSASPNRRPASPVSSVATNSPLPSRLALSTIRPHSVKSQHSISGRSNLFPLGGSGLRAAIGFCHDDEWPDHLVGIVEFDVRGRDRAIALAESQEVEPLRQPANLELALGVEDPLLRQHGAKNRLRLVG